MHEFSKVVGEQRATFQALIYVAFRFCNCQLLASLAADCYLSVTFTYIVIMPVVEAHFGICHFNVMLPTIYRYLFYCLLFVATDIC